MKLIWNEILHWGDNIQLVWTLRCLLSPAALTDVIEKGETKTASIKITFTKEEEMNQITKHSIWIGGRRHRTDNFVEIRPDTLCSTCRH